MVGLSVVLECYSLKGNANKATIPVINKANFIKLCPPPQPSHLPTSFLDQCLLCGQKLLPGKDIYMYKGNRAFCSVECRCRQIFMDEEGSSSVCGAVYKRHKYSWAACVN